MDNVRTEIYCFECDHRIIVFLDMTQEEYHEIHCTACEHQHFVTHEGEITDERPYPELTTVDEVADHLWERNYTVPNGPVWNVDVASSSSYVLSWTSSGTSTADSGGWHYYTTGS